MDAGMLAIVGAAAGVIGAIIGALGAMLAHRSWAEARFQALAVCDSRHDAEGKELRALCLKVDALAQDVSGLKAGVALLGERVKGGFARFDELIARLERLAGGAA